MEKSISRQHQQNPLAVPVSFAGIPGVGVEVPSTFLQQFVYGPYGFNPADMAAHQGVMDGRMSVGLDPSGLGLRMTAFQAPFIGQRAPEAVAPLHRGSAGQENRLSKPNHDKEPSSQNRQQPQPPVQSHQTNQVTQPIPLMRNLVSSLPEVSKLIYNK